MLGFLHSSVPVHSPFSSAYKGRLKWARHLYPTFSCHAGRNWVECWMKILTDCKGHPTVISNIRSFILLFSKWRRTRVQL